MEFDKFERAFYNKLVYQFPLPYFIVTHNDVEKGIFSKCNRQLDVTVRLNIEKRPIKILVDTKNWVSKIGLKTVENFIGMVEDVNPKIGILVSPLGFTKYADNRISTVDIYLELLTINEALELNLRELVRDIFPHDWAFHPQMAESFMKLKKGEVNEFIDALDHVPYEEWLSVIKYSLTVEYYKDIVVKALREISINHYDSGWRFNAITILSDIGKLNNDLYDYLINYEIDQEIKKFLLNIS